MKKLLAFLCLLSICNMAHAAMLAAVVPYIPTILSVIGGAVGIGGALKGAQASNAQAQIAATQSEYQAQQLDQQAGQTRASAQRTAIEQRRQAKIAQSNLQAKTGGGSTDASILGLTGDIAGEGEYNALSALYEGEERARGLEMQASSARGQAGQYRSSGADALAAGNTKAMTGIFSTASSLYGKYGAGGPTTEDPDRLGTFIKQRNLG